jgi:hypothetical protein
MRRRHGLRRSLGRSAADERRRHIVHDNVVFAAATARAVESAVEPLAEERWRVAAASRLRNGTTNSSKS